MNDRFGPETEISVFKRTTSVTRKDGFGGGGLTPLSNVSKKVGKQRRDALYPVRLITLNAPAYCGEGLDTYAASRFRSGCRASISSDELSVPSQSLNKSRIRSLGMYSMTGSSFLIAVLQSTWIISEIA